MEVESMTSEELYNLQKKIDNRIENIRIIELNERKRKAKDELDELRLHKDLILSLAKHTRTSCSDDNVCNGYGSATYGARCDKCHLIEILNNDWEDDFEVDITISITKIM